MQMEREHGQLRAAEREAHNMAEERQRAVQYANGEKQGLTRLLHTQDTSLKHLDKQLQQVPLMR